MTKILLVRHGHVEGIQPARFRGRAELSLTPRGLAEADAVAQRIASAWHPRVVYTSPLTRCVATGEAIGKACQIEVRVLDELNDIDYGDWQFRSYDEIRKAYPKLSATWFATPHLFRFPGGESLQDLVARTSNVLRLTLARHPEETVVLVGHDSVNRALLLQLIDEPLTSYWRRTQHPCCISEIDVVDGEVRVMRINETDHLSKLGVDS